MSSKNELKPWLKQMWCIPPEADGEFVAAMEEVLEVYQRPYDPQHPVLCMDESSKQLIGEVRMPLPAKPGEPMRYDCEYVRNGTANLFMAFEPLAGWRKVEATQHRGRSEWAQFIAELLTGRYQQVEKLVLVMDNLNTHAIGSLYETFAPEKARALAQKLEIHYTPKHGSWLNMAEIELSILSRQCLEERMEDQATLEKHLEAWQKPRNRTHRAMDWQFTTADARVKLKRLYPSVQP